MTYKVRRAIYRAAQVISCIAVAGWLWAGHLWFVEFDTFPRRPNPALGSIYRRNIHGIVVYQTMAQRDWLDKCEFWSGIIGFTGIAVMLLLKNSQPSSEPSFSGQWYRQN